MNNRLAVGLLVVVALLALSLGFVVGRELAPAPGTSATPDCANATRDWLTRIEIVEFDVNGEPLAVEGQARLDLINALQAMRSDIADHSPPACATYLATHYDVFAEQMLAALTLTTDFNGALEAIYWGVYAMGQVEGFRAALGVDVQHDY